MSSTSEEIRQISKIKRKVGIKNKVNSFKQNIINNRHLSGNKNIPVKSGKNCRCKKKCFERIAEHERDLNFTTLYKLSTKNEQDVYLQSLIKPEQKQRERLRSVVEKRCNRLGNYTYFIVSKNERIQVCNKAFISIFALSEKRVRRLGDLKRKGIVAHDKRGLSIGSRRAVASEICFMIKQHIDSLDVTIVNVKES